MELTAENLKQTLWQNMRDVREKKITPEEANASASQSREIIRIVRQEVILQGLKDGNPVKKALSGKK